MDCELLAPAGDFETALAAFDAGADAVYCGLSDFSARAFATNFSIEHLKDLIRYAHAARPESVANKTPGTRRQAPERRVYVTFNTVIDEANFEEAIDRLSRLEQAGPDAIIVQDIGVARICRKFFPGLALHASTQLVAHNLEGVLALRELGFTRVVLARELSLDEIRQIKQRCGDVELEVFVHGALCYSISGLCLYGAMEKGRSGNRGKCPYCCRQGHEVEKAGEGGQRNLLYPFSMKDLRLGEDVKKLADIGVASLKIEGRMKSPLYVASVTRWYRQFLGAAESLPLLKKDEKKSADRSGKDSAPPKIDSSRKVTSSDLETVFSRRTTELRFHSSTSHFNSSPIDPDSLGHLGTPIGTVKRVTRDREGRAWLRFHTMRALEKHDGLQFDALTEEGRHFGFGIQEMRQAISRAPVFEVAAGEDVEVALPEKEVAVGSGNGTKGERFLIHPGDTVYCSMSNAVKRMFPTPSFRSSDYPGSVRVDVEVSVSADTITATARRSGILSASVEGGKIPSFGSGRDSAAPTASIRGAFDAAKNPEKTFASVEKAFSKFGDTDYALGKLTLNDPERRFAPMSVLNDLRRDLVEKLDDARERERQQKADDAVSWSNELELENGGYDSSSPLRTVKIRADQSVPVGDWDEVIVSINASTSIPIPQLPTTNFQLRLAMPVWNGELEFNRLRTKVKALIRAGFAKWECSDLATLRMLKACGVTDITADWTLYAFNASALAELAERGVRRFVASPENCRENLQYLAESGYAVEFLKQQSTPLFVSLHEPAATEVEGLAIFRRDGLWITTKPFPRSFEVPEGASSRVDLSWDAGEK